MQYILHGLAVNETFTIIKEERLCWLAIHCLLAPTPNFLAWTVKMGLGPVAVSPLHFISRRSLEGQCRRKGLLCPSSSALCFPSSCSHCLAASDGRLGETSRVAFASIKFRQSLTESLPSAFHNPPASGFPANHASTTEAGFSALAGQPSERCFLRGFLPTRTLEQYLLLVQLWPGATQRASLPPQPQGGLFPPPKVCASLGFPLEFSFSSEITLYCTNNSYILYSYTFSLQITAWFLSPGP